MLDKFKQLQQLKELQGALAKEKREVEKQGVKAVVNGKMEVEEIVLNPELDVQKQAEILKDCINEAMQQIQKTAAQKMFQM